MYLPGVEATADRRVFVPRPREGRRRCGEPSATLSGWVRGLQGMDLHTPQV